MKKTLLALSLSLFAISSFASSMMTCESMTGSDSTLILAVNGGKLVQMRVQNQGSLPHVLMTHLISTNNSTSIYTIMGSADQLQLDNSVLREESGQARVGDERFDCLPN